MRILLSMLFVLSNAFALDCANFAKDTISMDKNEKAKAANTCKAYYVEQLKQNIEELDKSTFACKLEIEKVQKLITSARTFYDTTITELKCDHPDPAVEKRLEDSMIDLTYTLSERVEERACNHLDYVEAKSDAQVEIIMLEQTRVNLVQDA